jgi:hypothetical protein
MYIWSPGHYVVSFQIYHQEPCQFAVFINGVLLPATTVGSPTGSSVCVLQHIITLTDADVAVTPVPAGVASPTGFAAQLSVVNHTSFVPLLTLDGQTGSGSSVPQVVATFQAFKVADLFV